MKKTKTICDLPLAILDSIIPNFLDQKDTYHLKLTCKSLSTLEYMNLLTKLYVDIRYYQLSNLRKLVFTASYGEDYDHSHKTFLDLTPLQHLTYFSLKPPPKKEEERDGEKMTEIVELILPNIVKELNIDMGNFSNLILHNFPQDLDSFSLKTLGGQTNSLPKLPASLKRLFLTEWSRPNINLIPNWANEQVFSCLDIFSIRSVRDEFKIQRTKKFVKHDHCLVLKEDNVIAPELLQIIDGMLISGDNVHLLERFNSMWFLNCNISLNGNEFSNLCREISRTIVVLKINIVTNKISLEDIQKGIKPCHNLLELQIWWARDELFEGNFSSDINDSVEDITLSVGIHDKDFRKTYIDFSGFKRLATIYMEDFPYLIPRIVLSSIENIKLVETKLKQEHEILQDKELMKRMFGNRVSFYPDLREEKND
jgi:hypothetical protein